MKNRTSKNIGLLSVVVCTYNRSESLKDVFESLLNQKCCNGYDYELLIIDNNSSDRTKDVVDFYGQKFNGRLKYVFESNQGISYARNTGIKEAQGEIVAFTDDDCVVDKEWIGNINETFSRFDADCVFGKILPIWHDDNVPAWLVDNKRLWGMLALLELGNEEKVITSDKEKLFGANFAFRKDIFDHTDIFNPNLGFKGKKLTGGEDTEFFNTLMKMKKRVVYNPAICAWHKIEAHKTTKSYFRQWHFNAGISRANNIAYTRKNIAGIPFWFFKEAAIIFSQYIFYLAIFNREEAFRYYLKCFAIAGTFTGCYRNRKNHAKS